MEAGLRILVILKTWLKLPKMYHIRKTSLGLYRVPLSYRHQTSYHHYQKHALSFVTKRPNWASKTVLWTFYRPRSMKESPQTMISKTSCSKNLSISIKYSCPAEEFQFAKIVPPLQCYRMKQPFPSLKIPCKIFEIKKIYVWQEIWILTSNSF